MRMEIPSAMLVVSRFPVWRVSRVAGGQQPSCVSVHRARSPCSVQSHLAKSERTRGDRSGGHYNRGVVLVLHAVQSRATRGYRPAASCPPE